MLILIIKTIILGAVEGLTEFIPVSSTAHLFLAGAAIHISSGLFLEALSISIQSGAILAAVWYFWKTIWHNKALFWKVAVAFIPTAIAGLVLYPIIKPLFDNHVIIALGLIVGGIGLIAIRPIDTDEGVAEVSYRQAFLIGVMQIASFIPGVSRAGATLIGGTLLKIPRAVIVPFSFLLAIPTIIGASAVEIRHVSGLTHHEWLLIGLGTVVAFIVALATIRFFIRILTKKPLSWFGWYRIAVGLVVLLFFIHQ
ncbi:MAG TPA: undecaprenyl-diphosphate phosphatase [Candidatus Paceibacterota bacterium]|jgi:undecaprenyl-diphosphatase|nr:undecaprenyl-diphosphate phosphatase [Candidatus Paceibacterota bacterium]